MALSNILPSTLPAQAPINLPPEVFLAVNDLYIAFHNLVSQLNNRFLVMMSPNGHYWVASIDNAGALTWTDVGTVHP